MNVARFTKPEEPNRLSTHTRDAIVPHAELS